MLRDKIIRAWKDPEYRQSLSEEEREHLPENPAGAIELTDEELDMAAGGSWRQSYSQSYRPSNSQSYRPSNSQSYRPSNSRPSNSQSWSNRPSQSYRPSNSRSYSNSNSYSYRRR